jgi:hypothetical protein
MTSSAGAFPRKLVKQRRRDFLRLAWWRLGAIVVGALLISLVARAWIGEVEVSVWLIAPAVVVIVLGVMLPQLDGTYHLESGSEAEIWTAKGLKRSLGRKAHVVNGVQLEFRDIDHVAVSDRGVFVVGTKYTDSVKEFRTRARPQGAEWGNEIYDRARTVRLFLKSELRSDVP